MCIVQVNCESVLSNENVIRKRDQKETAIRVERIIRHGHRTQVRDQLVITYDVALYSSALIRFVSVNMSFVTAMYLY